MFRRREPEVIYVEKVLYATAKVDMYALGTIIRVGDRIPTTSPLFINMPHHFHVDPTESEEFHHGQ